MGIKLVMSGALVEDAGKKELGSTKEELLKWVNALLNTKGGYVIIHCYYPQFLEEFDKMIDNKLRDQVPDGMVYHDIFRRYITDDGRHVVFCVRCSSPDRFFSIVEFNTNVSLNGSCPEPTQRELYSLLAKASDSDGDGRTTTVDEKDRRDNFMENLVKGEEIMFGAIPFQEDLRTQAKSRDPRTQENKKGQNLVQALVDRIWKSRLPESISAFSLVPKGGSVYFDVYEKKENTADGRKKENEADGRKKGNETGGRKKGNEADGQKKKKKTEGIELCRFFCLGVELDDDEKTQLETKLQERISRSMLWIGRDKPEKPQIKFHEVRLKRDTTDAGGSQNTTDTGGSQNTTDTGGSQNTTDTGGSQNTTDTGGSQNTTDTGGSQNTTDTGGSQNTTDTGGSQNTTDTGGSQNTADTGGSQNTADTGGSQNTTDTGGSQNTTDTGGSQNTADTGGSQNTADTGGSQNTTDTGDSQNTTDTGGSQNTTDTGGSQNTTDTGGSQNTTDTGGSQNTTDTGGSQNTTDTGGSQNTTDTGGSLNTTDTGGSQNTTDTGGSQNTTDTGGSQNTTDTGGSLNTTDTGGSQNTTDTGGSQNTTDTGGSQNTTDTGGSLNTTDIGGLQNTTVAGVPKELNRKTYVVEVRVNEYKHGVVFRSSKGPLVYEVPRGSQKTEIVDLDTWLKYVNEFLEKKNAKSFSPLSRQELPPEE